MPNENKPCDEWAEVWDWAAAIWGDDTGYGFNHFFRQLASRRAKAEGWEELGSSDVWHACYDAVKRLKAEGTIKTREELQARMRDAMGMYC